MDRIEGVKIDPLVEMLFSTQHVGVVREELTVSERNDDANIKVRDNYKQTFE